MHSSQYLHTVSRNRHHYLIITETNNSRLKLSGQPNISNHISVPWVTADRTEISEAQVQLSSHLPQNPASLRVLNIYDFKALKLVF